MPSPLTPDERSAMSASHPRWAIDGEQMSRTFEFGDFSEALGFVVRLGIAAEQADHHPDIDIRWNKVTVVLSTHSAGALTDLDLGLATAADSLDG